MNFLGSVFKLSNSKTQERRQAVFLNDIKPVAKKQSESVKSTLDTLAKMSINSKPSTNKNSSKLKDCPPGKIRNPITNRCVKIENFRTK